MLKDDLLRGAAAAAEYLGPQFNRNSVYYMTRVGTLPAIRRGSQLFYRKSDLDRAFTAEAAEAA
jgi:hypothetical protein